MEIMELRKALGLENDGVFHGVVPQKMDSDCNPVGVPTEYLTVLEGIVYSPLRPAPLVEFYCPEAGDENEAFDEWLSAQKCTTFTVSFRHVDGYGDEWLVLSHYVTVLDGKYVEIWDLGIGCNHSSAITTLFATQEHIDRIVAHFGPVRSEEE